VSEALTWRPGARGYARLVVSLLVAAGWGCVGYEVFALLVDAALAGRWSGVPILGALLVGLAWVLAYLITYVLNSTVVRVELDGATLRFATPLRACAIDLGGVETVAFLGSAPGMRYIAFSDARGISVLASLAWSRVAFDEVQSRIEAVLGAAGKAGVIFREPAPPRVWRGVSFRVYRLRVVFAACAGAAFAAAALAIALHWNAPALGPG
jgi:hypothetical protein